MIAETQSSCVEFLLVTNSETLSQLLHFCEPMSVSLCFYAISLHVGGKVCKIKGDFSSTLSRLTGING